MNSSTSVATTTSYLPSKSCWSASIVRTIQVWSTASLSTGMRTNPSASVEPSIDSLSSTYMSCGPKKRE